MKQKTIITIAFISAALFFVGLYTDNYLLRMITKPIPILALILLIKQSSHYNKYIFLGLGFSVTGDFLLESSPTMFVFGLIAFLIAHLLYTVAFVKRNRQLSFLPLLILSAYGVSIYWLLYPGLQQMAIPVLLYIIVILIMSWRAIAQRNFDHYAIYAAIGSLIFVLSDSIIAFSKFYVDIPLARWFIMVTYWSAQGLIFYSTQSLKLFKSNS